MGNIPLHPLVVHIPLVLALVLPIVLIALGVATSTGRLRAGAWWIGVAVAAVLLATAFVAIKTGQEDEEVVEEYVAETAIHTHEERGEAFLWVSVGLVLLTALPALLRDGRARAGLVLAAIVASTAAAGFAVAVGHSGGSLVYEHNAAAAHAGGSPVPPRMVGEHREDSEERERH